MKQIRIKLDVIVNVPDELVIEKLHNGDAYSFTLGDTEYTPALSLLDMNNANAPFITTDTAYGELGLELDTFVDVNVEEYYEN